MEKMVDVLQQPELSGAVRDALNRVGLRENNPLDRVKDAWQQARSWLESLAATVGGNQETPSTLNATGQLLGGAFSGVPSVASVAYGYAKAAMDFQDTLQAERTAAAAVASNFSGSKAVWMSSTAEALRLLANSDLASDGVLIARADAVRIPGLGDVRGMLAECQRPLIEVGAANGSTADDWNNALSGERQLVVLTSPNSLSSAEAATHRQTALAAAKSKGAKVIEVLADGVLNPQLIEKYRFPDPRQHLASGADVVLLPMHLLMGGPQSVVVVGDSHLLDRVRKTSEICGTQLSGAGLVAAAIALQISALPEESESGLLARLLANPENLKNRARRIAVQLSGVGEVAEALEIEHNSALGGTPWNRYTLRSWSVRLKPKTNLESLQRELTAGAARQGLSIATAQEPDALLLNLRFVPPQSDHELVSALSPPQPKSTEEDNQRDDGE